MDLGKYENLIKDSGSTSYSHAQYVVHSQMDSFNCLFPAKYYLLLNKFVIKGQYYPQHATLEHKPLVLMSSYIFDWVAHSKGNGFYFTTEPN